MTSTSELRKALAVDGAARKALAAAWGDWANEFCDALLSRLPLLTTSYKIHLWSLGETGTRASGAGGYQVNIDVGNSGGYTVDVTDDPWAAIGRRIKNEDLVCGADASEEGVGGSGGSAAERLRGLSATIQKEIEEEGDDPSPVSGLFVHEL